MKKMVNMPVVGLALGLFLVSQSGCTGPTKAAAVKQPATPGISKLSGTVAETMDAGGYTYINVEKDGKKSWAAVPTISVKVGQQVDLMAGSVLNKFESKALNRTFDSIVFSGGMQPDASQKPVAQPVAQVDKYAGMMSDKPILSGKLVETMNAPSYTYLLLEKDGKVAWAAVPATQVTVGDQLELIPGVDMGKFSSTSLKRVFNTIHFSAGIKLTEAQKEAAAKAAEAVKVAEAVKAADAENVKLPVGHPALPTQPAPSAAGIPAAKPIVGKVVETMDAGGYTYICLENEGKKTWAAVPVMQVSVGQELALNPGNEMAGFNSKSLGRSFDQIIFSSGVVTVGK